MISGGRGRCRHSLKTCDRRSHTTDWGPRLTPFFCSSVLLMSQCDAVGTDRKPLSAMCEIMWGGKVWEQGVGARCICKLCPWAGWDGQADSHKAIGASCYKKVCGAIKQHCGCAEHLRYISAWAHGCMGMTQRRWAWRLGCAPLDSAYIVACEGATTGIARRVASFLAKHIL